MTTLEPLAVGLSIVLSQIGPKPATNPLDGPCCAPGSEVVWDQGTDGTQQGFASQDFEAAYNAYDVQVFMDFETTQDWRVETVTSAAFRSNPPCGSICTQDVIGQIWSDVPWNGGRILLSSVAGSDCVEGSGEVCVDFGGQRLPAGQYYFSVFLVRDFRLGGQTFLHGRAPIGDHDTQYNPGLGFQLCYGVWCETRDANNVMYDVNFVMTGSSDGGCDPCDTNCDGVVDAFDIDPFVQLLTNPGATPCAACSGDANGDGRIDAFDIEPFVACLVGP